MALAEGHPFPQTLGPPPPIAPQTGKGFSAQRAWAERQAIPAESLAAYKKALTQTGDFVVMMGRLIGATAIRMMREDIKPVDTAHIWGGQEKFTCPAATVWMPPIRPAKAYFLATRTGRTLT